MSSKKPRCGRHPTYTKKMMSRIINIALVDMQLPFVLALLGRSDIAETLGGIIASEVIGVFLVYCAKSFFETRESEKVRMEEMKMETETGSEEPESEEMEEIEL